MRRVMFRLTLVVWAMAALTALATAFTDSDFMRGVYWGLWASGWLCYISARLLPWEAAGGGDSDVGD